MQIHEKRLLRALGQGKVLERLERLETAMRELGVEITTSVGITVEPAPPTTQKANGGGEGVQERVPGPDADTGQQLDIEDAVAEQVSDADLAEALGTGAAKPKLTHKGFGRYVLTVDDQIVWPAQDGDKLASVPKAEAEAYLDSLQ